MASLAGVVSDRPAEDLHRELTSMMECMLHESHYTQRTYSIPTLGCCVGIVSHDEAFADCQIRVSSDRSQLLVVAGEHFGDDTGSSIDALFETHGSNPHRFLRALNGWFAGIMVDLGKKTMLLFNDRLGLGRLHYTTMADSFAFASEAKSLLAVRPHTRSLNPTAVGQYLSVGAVLNDLTLFNDVFLIPGGSAWSLGPAGRVVKRRYFTPCELETQPALSEAAFGSALRETLAKAVPRYFGGRRSVAVSLTGGLDTRGIMAFAPEVAEPRAYTYRGMFRDAYDVRIAREVASVRGYRHDVLPIGKPFLETFPELAAQTVWTTDGTLEVSASHEVYLSRLARQIAPVRITGNYGSEILRSVSTFKPIRLARQIFDNDFLPFIEEGERALTEAKRAHPISFAVFREIPWSLYGRLAAAQSQLTVRSPYTDNDIVALVYRRPRERGVQTRVWQQLIAQQSPLLASIPTDRGIGIRHSRVGRSDRLLRYLTFKAEWYYESGMPSWLARIDARVGRGRTPPWFVGSHKIENYRLWFRDDLFPWVRASLCDSSTALPYFAPDAVREITIAHGAGAGNFTREISRILSIELIQKTLIACGPRHGNRLAIPQSTRLDRLDFD